MQTFIAIKNPELFKPDYIFEVPEQFRRNGYVNMGLEHAKNWYIQIYPPEIIDETKQTTH